MGIFVHSGPKTCGAQGGRNSNNVALMPRKVNSRRYSSPLWRANTLSQNRLSLAPASSLTCAGNVRNHPRQLPSLVSAHRPALRSKASVVRLQIHYRLITSQAVAELPGAMVPRSQESSNSVRAAPASLVGGRSARHLRTMPSDVRRYPAHETPPPPHCRASSVRYGTLNRS